MNRRPDAPDPLSPEERDLAERLLRLGPHDGPSPALDARILAAAHAAVAQTPRAREKKTRWPAWIGVAASLSLAVGIAWQLRPMDKAPEAMSEEAAVAAISAPPDAAADAAAAANSAQDSMMAEQAAPAGAAAADAPASAAAADAAASAEGAAATAAPPPPPPPAEPIVAKRESERRRAPAELSARAQTYEVAPAPAYSPSVERLEPQAISAPAITPAPPAPTSDLAAPADPAAAVTAPKALARDSDAAKPAAAAKSRAAATHSAPAYAPLPAPAPAGERRAASAAANEASPLGGNLFQGAPPSADAQREKRSDADADAEAKQAPPLDRVQVTGARIGSGGADEHNLPAPQWLDLIRDYRDSGQTDRARESLLQFRREHPRVRIPKDLRPLLK